MNELMNSIDLDTSLRSRVTDVLCNKEEKVERLATVCKDKGFSVLARCDDITRLAVCLRYAELYTAAKYKELGISEDILLDTLGDIAIWCANNGNRGLKNYRWIQNHLQCSLFRIGRLQYQLSTADSKLLDYRHLPYDKGDNIIYVHIPQGEPLAFEECVASIGRAKEFLSTYFADFHYQFMVCESWLMYEDNYLFMDSGCNILQFQSLFELVYSARNDRQAIERIFGKRHILLSRYPSDTSLQRNAIEYMREGNKLGMGIGIIDIMDE